MEKWLETPHAGWLEGLLRKEFILLIREEKLPPKELGEAVDSCLRWAYENMEEYARVPLKEIAPIASRTYLSKRVSEKSVHGSAG